MLTLSPNHKIYVSGHNGMVGAAICRELKKQGFSNVITASRDTLDLTYQSAVFDFFAHNQPDVQIICAAVVGGIVANNNFPADFIGKNLMIQTNLLEAARRTNCHKTLFMGSSCIYPRITPQPMEENQLLTGELEPTNQWYAMAKLAGIKMGQAYRQQYNMDITSVLPTNLYGAGDNFDLENSHVIPGMMHRFHLAKINNAPQVTVWGSGNAKREFLNVDDLANATLFIIKQELQDDLFNIGYGKDITIMELAQLIKEVVGYLGELFFDTQRPDGTPRKLLNSNRLFSLGWQPTVALKQGLMESYQWFLENYNCLRDSQHFLKQ